MRLPFGVFLDENVSGAVPLFLEKTIDTGVVIPEVVPDTGEEGAAAGIDDIASLFSRGTSGIKTGAVIGGGIETDEDNPPGLLGTTGTLKLPSATLLSEATPFEVPFLGILLSSITLSSYHFFTFTKNSVAEIPQRCF